MDHERTWHINKLELVGAISALKSMAKPGDHVLLHLDNKTALSYLRKRGGTKNFQLCKLAVKTGIWLMENDVLLSVEYISSKENVIADMMSRFHIDFWEFSLKKDVYDYIMKIFKAKPTMDVFASNLTAKMNIYCSWHQDQNAIAHDAFLLENWSPLPYLFPPTPLLAKVMREVELRKTMAIKTVT